MIGFVVKNGRQKKTRVATWYELGAQNILTVIGPTTNHELKTTIFITFQLLSR